MTEPRCATVQEWAPELALGGLTGPERTEALEHLGRCSHCRSAVQEFAQVADLLLVLTPEIEPPPGFGDRVVRSMTATTRFESRRRWRPAVAVVAIAAAASLVGAIVWASGSGAPSTVTAASKPRVVTMIGGGGLPVGRVSIVRPSGAGSSTSSTLTVTLDYAVPDGTYALELRSPGGAQALGTVAVVGWQGSWSGAAAVPAGAVTIAMVDASGTTVCSAALHAD